MKSYFFWNLWEKHLVFMIIILCRYPGLVDCRYPGLVELVFFYRLSMILQLVAVNLNLIERVEAITIDLVDTVRLVEGKQLSLFWL